MLTRIVRHELASLAADRTLWIVLVVFAALIGYAAGNGSRWADAEAAALEAVAAAEAERFGVMRITLTRIEAGRAAPPASPYQDPTRPAAVGRALGERNATLPLAPLAALSVGQRDILPSVVPVSTESRYGLPGREEIANPLHLLAGRLDLAFVMLFLLPLLLLALSHDMLSREREGGTLALLLSQPLRLRTLVLGKALARAVVALGATLLFTILALVLAGVGVRSPGAAAGLALWAGVITAYTGFWLALAALVNLLGRSSAQQAVTLAAAWLLLAIVVPSALAIGARVFYPVPSRAEMIAAEREAARAAEAEGSGLLARYYEDHPELVPGGEEELDDFLRQAFAVQVEVDRRMEPVRRRYDAQIAGQRTLVDRLRFLSPVLLAQAALDDIAGTGDARHRRFQEHVEAFRAEYHAFFAPRIYEAAPFTAADAAAVPAWRYTEQAAPAVARRVAGTVLWILVPTLLLAAGGALALRRYSPAG